MHRLHVKIFLWFWLSVVVVSTTLVALTELTHSRAEDDVRWRGKYTRRLDLWAQQETSILRTKGPAALETYVGSFASDPGVRNYVFDESGQEVLKRQVTPEVSQVVASMNDSPSGEQHVDDEQRIIAEKIVDTRGNRYVVVVDFPPPSILSRSLIDLLAVDRHEKGLTPTAIVRLLIVVTVAGMFCYVLARHIANPINRLRAATQAIANNRLQTRVDTRVLTRRDELADLGRDFDWMAARIERSVTAQQQLLSDVSHALRSPLARLNVALGLAQRQAEPTTSVHLHRIERETERLNLLIGQLLTIARLDSGVDAEQRALFDLGHVVDEVATDADYEARSRHRTVQFDQHRECIVEGARDMLRGAIENVVRNAIHYTAETTSVHISMDCRNVGGTPTAVIEVSDHGPGVPDEALDHLFTPFYRVPHGGADNSMGTGLGLAITRRAFEVHKGTAIATKGANGGLVVTLELPLYAANGLQGSPQIAGEPPVEVVA